MIPEDVARLSELPLYEERTGEEYVDALTRRFSRTPNAPTMTLRPIQALMLAQAVAGDGLVALAGCGSGKTLTTLLLPLVLKAKRPLLLIPASMRAQFASDRGTTRNIFTSPSSRCSVAASAPKQVTSCELAPDLVVTSASSAQFEIGACDVWSA